MRGDTAGSVGMEGASSVGGGAATNAVSASLNGNAPPPFLSKTYDMVDDPSTDAIVSWGPGNNSFVVWNVPEFSRDLLPKHFKHNNFSSFVRQLNTYGFRKVDPDKWEFANEGFLRGQKHLLKSINRRKPSHAHNQQAPPQQAASSTIGACVVEVGKFGLEEEIERLKRDKNVLMQELVRLRQQQQSTDHQLQTLTQRLQGMEQRQQQMMSFLAKAMQSPGFLAQLVQQNENNRRIVEVSKKRRLPKQENNLGGSSDTSSDGQIIKYQPLMTEAAKAMLMQILKLDLSPRLESSEGFLIEGFSSSSSNLDQLSSQMPNSGVTLKEVPASSVAPYLPSSPDVPAIPSSYSSIPEIATSEIPPDSSNLTSMSVPESSNRIHGSAPGGGGSSLEGAADGFASSVSGPESLFLDQIGVADGEVSIGMDSFAIDFPMDEDTRLPCINDSFWEQFLVESPLPDDVSEEAESSVQEMRDMQKEADYARDGAHPLEHLTEQMGLLSPDPKN